LLQVTRIANTGAPGSSQRNKAISWIVTLRAARSTVWPARAYSYSGAFRIAGRRALPQPHRRLIGLVRIEQILRKLGGLAEAQRQQPGRQRIERAGMAGLVGAQQPLGADQRIVRRQPERLVEQQHAMHVAARQPGRTWSVGIGHGR
jgi:hypothetical protein